MNDLSLFELPEQYQADPPLRRKTYVKGHERVLPPGAVPHQAITPTARRTDPESSRQAAARNRLSADNDRGRALLALVDGGPGHDFDLAERTGRRQTSIGVRRKELVTLGLVEHAGEMKPNADGAMCAVWRVTEAGIQKARELRGTA